MEKLELTLSVELPGTPKRGRGDESPGENNSKVPKSDFLPELGSKIVFETVKGKCEYTVETKKNNKEDDFSYTLINSERKKMEFDLKTVQWEYSKDSDPLSSVIVESSPILE